MFSWSITEPIRPLCSVRKTPARQRFRQSGQRAWHYEKIDTDVFGEKRQQAAYAEVERIA